MKRLKLLVSALLLSCSFTYAQTFEGTIEWKMTFEITDPKTKKEMADAEKQMNDPKTKAQMAELEKQMNDPEMKAMMESNPAVKAQMEKMVEMSKGGGMSMSKLMPSGMTIKTKDNNSITNINGSIGQAILHLANGDSYTIDNNAKTYYKNTIPPSPKSTQSDKYKITKTTETAKILNYNCIKYKIEYTENQKSTINYVWASTEVKDFDWQKLKNTSNFKRNSEWIGKIDGVPLKIQIQEPTANVTMEVIKIQKETLSNDLFKLPNGYKEVAPSTLGH